MTILAVLLVVAAFCVAFYFANREGGVYKRPIIIVLAVLLVLFLLWQAGALGFLNMRIGR